MAKRVRNPERQDQHQPVENSQTKQDQVKIVALNQADWQNQHRPIQRSRDHR